MRSSSAIFAVVPLCALLTGCPLTDHYRLQEDSLGAAGAPQSGHAGAPSAGVGAQGGEAPGGGAADAGEPSSNGGAGIINAGGSAGAGDTGGTAGSENCVANCSGRWVEMATPPEQLVARSKAAAVAMGDAVFIWGGLDNGGAALNNGAIYYPATDTWKPLQPDPGSPSPRINATAVWTGAASHKVIVFGGTDATGGMVYRDGGVYDVVDNSWLALPMNMTTSKRSAPYGYWDGTRAVFFGGLNAMLAVVPGVDRFDLKTWSTSAPGGDPGLLGFPAIAFDGSVMYLQGGVIGSTRQDKVFAYTSSTDKWATLPTGPSIRTGAFGAWDGSHFVVWGGQDDFGLRNDGKFMSGTTWSDMTATDVLTPRRIAFRRSGWAFQVKPGVVALMGGQTSISGSAETLATDGASYDVSSGQWTAIPAWPSKETHEYGIGAWTGAEFVVWGGRALNVSTLTGERWVP